MYGLCFQHYHLIGLHSASGKKFGFRGLTAQFFPDGLKAALLVVTQHQKIEAGIFDQEDLFGARKITLSCIKYTISSCDGQQFCEEDFYHPFTKETTLEDCWIRPKTGNLFELQPLSELLHAPKRFPGVQGVQFVS
jgi:hypothetical protein